jgi:hypothetical protein
MSFRLGDQARDMTNIADQMTSLRNTVEVHSERFNGQAATLASHGTLLQAQGERLDAMDGKLDTIIKVVSEGPSGSS